jgi:hypothetical protein
MAGGPNFGRGGESAAEAEEQLSASRGGNFRKTNYLPKIGKGKSIFIRYVLDSQQWYYANAHPAVPTKNKPANWPEGRSWPKTMPAVCRYDKTWKGIHADCYICDAKLINEWGRPCNPVLRVWTIAVIREEVIGTQEMVDKEIIPAEMVGKRVGFKDATREIDEVDAEGKPTGNKKQEIAMIVVNQAMPNYFSGLQAMFGVFGTLCDRDYVLLQKDEGKDVDFQHIHMDPSASHQPGTESWKRYEQAIKDQGIDIEALLVDRASDDFYATFFDPNKEAPIKEKKEDVKTPASAPTAQQAAAPDHDVDQEALKAMRDRLKVQGPVTVQETASAGVGQIDFSS